MSVVRDLLLLVDVYSDVKGELIVAAIERLFRLAHDCANHAGRARPIATDLMLACRDIGLETSDMHRVEMLSRKRKRGACSVRVSVDRCSSQTFVHITQTDKNQTR